MTSRFEKDYHELLEAVKQQGDEVEVGEWQSQDVRSNPDMISRELMHVTFGMSIPSTMRELDTQMGATLSRPWAEDHFQERVSGYPLNPPPSESYWPYAQEGNATHKEGELFSHTYPERMWSKSAGHMGQRLDYERMGIRFPIGDLMDVVNQLDKNPWTRQAYLPIWFPEDTGAVQGQRVPCTLGYHFLVRRGKMDIVYYIRSCDLLRHFTDDVYMAARLCQGVRDQVHGPNMTGPGSFVPGDLIMHISSLHFFRGDYPIVDYKLDQFKERTKGTEIGPDGEDEIYGAPV